MRKILGDGWAGRSEVPESTVGGAKERMGGWIESTWKLTCRRLAMVGDLTGGDSGGDGGGGGGILLKLRN